MKASACLALAAFALLPAAAKPAFDRVLQDHMVVQRDKPAVFWGTAKPGDAVTVEWKGTSAQTQASADGSWEVRFPASAACAEGARLTARDSEGTAVLDDLLVGDLWLASGQSNMAWMVKQTSKQSRTIDWDALPQLRLLRADCLLKARRGSYTLEEYDKAVAQGGYTWEWRVCTDAAVQDFSAVAASFAQRICQTQGVPVGIICNAVGGTPMESWMPQDVIDRDPRFASIRGDDWMSSPDYFRWAKIDAPRHIKPALDAGRRPLHHSYRPAWLFERSVRPLLRLPIRGVIWYQGEANADDADIAAQRDMVTTLIQSWRKAFGQQALPFIMVQLPRFGNQKAFPYWPEFREAQQQAARQLRAVGLACTIDLGSTNGNIHPPEKEPVGFRLADIARKLAYGEKGLPQYPHATGWKRQGSHIRIEFDRELTTADGQPPRGFTVGRRDERDSFVPAAAEIKGRRIILTLPEAVKDIPRQQLVWRYIATTAANPNLVAAKGGLPAFPARQECLPKGK